MKIFSLAVSVFILCSMNSCEKSSHSENESIKEPETTTSIKPQSSLLKEVPFIIAEKYFVKNSVDLSDFENLKIETEKKFKSIFGMATVMGNDGKPTAIDFSKNYVIAIIKPETDLKTEIIPIRLQKNNKNEVIVNYELIKGEKQSYKTIPCLILVIDKENDGFIVLKEIEIPTN